MARRRGAAGVKGVTKMGHFSRSGGIIAILGAAAALAAAPDSSTPAAGHDFPTVARVEYVQDCMRRNGGEAALLYQCSCVIDRIAAALSYDEFVEASTFAKYATLPGEGGGIFRDPDVAKQKTKLYRELESNAYKACGITPPSK